MKKFTRNFLLEEHSIWRFLRKIGLGLALVIWTTFAFAQNPVTYQLKAQSYDGCYRTDNTYQIPVTMKDFIKIKQFSLVLDYANAADFDFVGVTNVNSALSGMTVQQLTDGELTFNWSSATPVTIESSTETVMFKLNFNVAGFQHQYAIANQFVFASTLKWKTVGLWNDAGQCTIQSGNIIDGAMTVTEKWQSVVVDAATANCAGTTVEATVSTPAYVSGMLYSFNGSTFNATNKSQVTAPSTQNTLVIKDASCISYIKKFDVAAITPVSFAAATPVYTACAGGLGDIEILAKDGTAPYTYYVIPETQWSAGDMMLSKLTAGDASGLSKYAFNNYVYQGAPGKYYVAVQDANGCASLTGTNLLSWWKLVEVVDAKTPIVAIPTPNQDLMTTCYGQPDGRIDFTIAGGTPYKTGYMVLMDGKYVGKLFEFDSNVNVLCNGEPCNHAVLAAGTYNFIITDSLGCSSTVSYTVTQPKKIVFDVAHTDAGCGQPVGELWIASVDASTGSGATSSWSWYYTTDPSWATGVQGPFAVATKVSNIPAGYYYVKMVDAAGCYEYYTNASGDNAIKVLTTEFDITAGKIACNGGSTSVTISLVSGDGNHTFKYSKDNVNWQTSNVFTGITAGTYTFYVKDETAQGCVVPLSVTITEPEVLDLQVLATTTFTSCPGTKDANVAVSVTGGTPWKNNVYKFLVNDGRPESMASYATSFTMGAGQYVITVKDSAGCSANVTVDIPVWNDSIDFQNVIPVECAGDKVNLFNANPDNDWYRHIHLDGGYLNYFQWYPFNNPFHDSQAIFDWAIRWTSGGGWQYIPVQGVIASRNPKLYVSDKPWVNKSDIVTNGEIVTRTTTFGAGTYFVVAKDEWGCYSNVDTIKIVEPKVLAVDYSVKDAQCFGTVTGEVTLTAKNGKDKPEINESGVKFQYYALNATTPDLFNGENWQNQVTWMNFNGLSNDSTQTIALGAGTWWFAVRDYCGVFDPSQIQIVGPVTVKELAKIDGSYKVTTPACNGYDNGQIVVTATGGSGALTYKLVKGTKTYTNTNTNGGYTFTGLTAGDWTLTVSDVLGCPPYSKIITVTQPDKLTVSLTGVDASCYGSKDGIVRYTITGGTAPYMESTNNGDNWFDVGSTKVFDRRVGAGTYIVWLQDSNGCEAKDTIIINQPAAITASTVVTNVSCSQPTSCAQTNVTDDGSIKVTFGGGWASSTDNFIYVVKLWKGTTLKATATASAAGNCVFGNLVAGDYTVQVFEYNPALYATPIISDPDYISEGTSYVLPVSGKQNPDLYCVNTLSVTVGKPADITYSVTYSDVLCRNTNTGKAVISGIAGGTAPYQVMIEGPAGYANNMVWKVLGTGVNTYTYSDLPYGHYNIFVKDKVGCQICLQAGTVNNVDSLALTMSLIDNVNCFGTSTGKIKVNATGGVGGYKYAVLLASSIQAGYFPADLDNAGSLTWQDSPEFSVGAGTWIGFVKDANGCYQGGATTSTGAVILNHRVVVLQPTAVTASATYGTTAATGMVDCYGNATGGITITAMGGGSGLGWNAVVTGKDYTGADVEKYYSDVKVGDILNGLKASTNVTDPAKIPNTEKYTVVVMDSHGCQSAPILVPVMQPVEFTISLVVTQDAFVCPSDLAGLFQIKVTNGGTGSIQYMYEAWDGTTKKFFSNWGAVNTFQGPAGLTYKVWAKDANGCVAYAEKFVNKPAEIVFTGVKDISCFADAKASAVVSVTGETGRTFQLYYKAFNVTTWTKYGDPFTGSITCTGVLNYGNAADNTGHYYFKVVDNMGCEATSPEITFVPVQVKLNVCCPDITPGECTSTLSVNITGGIAPYTVYIDEVAQTGTSWVVASGIHTVKVVDSHNCVSTIDVTINANPVERTATAETYVGEKVHFTDAEAQVDAMLEKGVHTFTYDFNGCPRKLTVTVTEIVRYVAIADIQGTGDVSPVKDLYRGITGTVTGVVPGVGYFVQDAVAEYSGIWVADTHNTVIEGNGIKVDGTVAEVNGVTTLNAANVQLINPPLTITPILVASPSVAEQEKYESVLVLVKGARFQGSVNPDGSWVIKTTETDNVVVDDWMYAYTPVDGHYFDVTGIVNGALDLYKLEPRKAADVVDLTQTTPIKEITDNLQFNVYPNPFSEYLNISNSDKLTRVIITNIAGQRVMDVQYPENVIRTSNLVSGVYVVTLFTENGIAKSERIVKR